MFSMTKHRDRTCLTSDDLEGLNFLYPTCEGAMQPRLDTGEPLCIKGKRLGGWLRLIYAVLVPWVIVSAITVLTQCTVRMHQKRRLKNLKTTIRKQSQAHKDFYRGATDASLDAATAL